MGVKRRGEPIHGWVALDKPLGVSSAQAVARVRKALGAAKAGHGGTLDPLASGLLPIALGEATKTVSFVMDGAKSYRWQVTWGEARDTDDLEGEVIERSDHRPDLAGIDAALAAFKGEIVQVPPLYSAVKVKGRRAYDLARNDVAVELAPRRVRIDRIEMVEATTDTATFETDCGKGAYIRSLARDIARALGTVGHVSMLRRTRCGPFREDCAICLDKLEEFGHSAASANIVLPVGTALDDIPALALTEDEARRLQTGQILALSRLVFPAPLQTLSDGQTVRAAFEGRLVALARIEDAMVRPVRVLNL